MPTYALSPNQPEDVNCTSGAMVAPPNPARVNRSGPAGIWVAHGDVQDLLNQSFVLGGDTGVNWADVEVADDVWDWRATDMAWARQAAAGFYIETSLQVGARTPPWLYADKQQGGGGLTATLVVMSSDTGARGWVAPARVSIYIELYTPRSPGGILTEYPDTGKYWCNPGPRPLCEERHIPILPMPVSAVPGSDVPDLLPSRNRSLCRAHREPAEVHPQQDHRQPGDVRQHG